VFPDIVLVVRILKFILFSMTKNVQKNKNPLFYKGLVSDLREVAEVGIDIMVCFNDGHPPILSWKPKVSKPSYKVIVAEPRGNPLRVL
ncbi:MAG: hypothetical protein ABIF22_00660, partial [bacterium]